MSRSDRRAERRRAYRRNVTVLSEYADTVWLLFATTLNKREFKVRVSFRTETRREIRARFTSDAEERQQVDVILLE